MQIKTVFKCIDTRGVLKYRIMQIPRIEVTVSFPERSGTYFQSFVPNL